LNYLCEAKGRRGRPWPHTDRTADLQAGQSVHKCSEVGTTKESNDYSWVGTARRRSLWDCLAKKNVWGCSARLYESSRWDS
jgi:hypothetical protein